MARFEATAAGEQAAGAATPAAGVAAEGAAGGGVAAVDGAPEIAEIAAAAAVADDPATALEAQPAAHHDSFGGAGGFAFRLVVAPAPGRLRHLPPSAFHEGHEWVDRGQVLALIEQGSTAVEVRSPVEGRLAGVLVRDGEPVLRGQPLVWLDEGRRGGREAG